MSIEEFFARHGVWTWSARNRENFLAWSARGSDLQIVSPVCPDYSCDQAADGSWWHTFERLDTGIGLAGQRLLQFAPRFHRWLRAELRVERFEHRAYVGDIEGYSVETLKRLRIGGEDFGSRVSQSIERLGGTAGSLLSAHAMSSLCGGETGFRRAVRAVRDRAHAGEFDELTDRALIRELGEAERARYERWFLEERVDDNLLSLVVIRRAMENAAIGSVIASAFPNPLILTIGENAMAQFFGLAADVPVLDLAPRCDPS